MQTQQQKIRLGKRVLLNSEEVELEGPSEELVELSVDISTIPNDQHMAFVTGLTSLMKTIDSRFSRKTPTGGKRVFVGYAKESKAVTFYWTPLYIPNLLKQLRTTRYRLLETYGDVLKIGNKKVHIVPTHMLPTLQNEITELNERVMRRKVMDGMAHYEQTRSWASVIEYFEGYGIKIETPLITLYDMTVDHAAISVDPEFYIQHAERKVQEMMGHISDEERKGLDAMKTRLAEKESEMVNAIEGRFKEQLAVFVDMLSDAASGKVKDVKGRYGRLKRKLAVGGADPASPVFSVLDQVVDAIRTKSDDKTLQASNAIAGFLGIQPRANATDTLRLASEALKGEKANIFLELL